MSLILAIFLAIPALVFANIEIEVVAADNQADQYAKFYGSDVEIISDVERKSFQLSDNQLKEACGQYFGARPDDAYVRSPTPWGDLYYTYGWSQVQRTLTPKQAKIIEVKTDPIMLLSQYFHNNSTKTASFKAQVSQSVKITTSSTWSRASDLTIGQEISYGFDIKVAAASGKTKLSYSSKFGQSVTKSDTVTIGSMSGVDIVLEPNQSVIAELYANRGTMKVQVDYVARLAGAVAVNYSKTYRGHHFWALDINRVMEAGNMKKEVEAKEVITLGYYSEAKVLIRDSKSKSVLYSIPVMQH